MTAQQSQTFFPLNQNFSFTPSNQQSFLFNSSQNQLFVAIPINQYGIPNYNFLRPGAAEQAELNRNTSNYRNDPGIKEEADVQNCANKNEQKGPKFPEVKHKVKYFDVSSAPLITSNRYNMIDDVFEKKK